MVFSQKNDITLRDITNGQIKGMYIKRWSEAMTKNKRWIRRYYSSLVAVTDKGEVSIGYTERDDYRYTVVDESKYPF